MILQNLPAIRECERQLARIYKEEQSALALGAKWKLRNLDRQRGRWLKRKIELSHGELFKQLGWG